MAVNMLTKFNIIDSDIVLTVLLKKFKEMVHQSTCSTEVP